MRNENQNHLESQEGTWIRGLFMLLFMIIHRLASIVLCFLVLVQFIYTVVKDRRIDRLSRFTVALNKYIYQAGIFSTYQTEVKPYPFTNWPDDSDSDGIVDGEVVDDESASATSETAAPASKPAAKKRAPAKPRAPKPKDAE